MIKSFLKLDYLKYIQKMDLSYDDNTKAISSIRKLYGTARLCGLNKSVATILWGKFFGPLRLEFQHMPESKMDYDSYAIKKIRLLAKLLSKHNLLEKPLGNFGIAQKMFNLFVKHHWALKKFPASTERNLHLPLDRRVLYKLGSVPKTWAQWTRAKDNKNTIQAYEKIQEAFRAEWRRLDLFESPIEMEQFIWYRISNGI